MLRPDPVQAEVSETTLWTPLPVVPGRGMALADGRVVSPQQAAYESPADELFFGGSAGGGKTQLLIGLAVTRHRHSVIFRREYGQLRGPEGIIEQSRRIIGLRGHYAGADGWRDISGGRSLEFGAMQYEEDKTKWQGRAHDLKCYDEISELTEGQYRFTVGWLRTTEAGQRTRVVCTGNPPTHSEGQWVVRYWGPWLDPHHPRPAKAGELRWYAVVDGKDLERPDGTPFLHAGDLLTPRSRTFIPGNVEDNTYLMRTGYASVLESLPEPLRSQMRYGNFHATAMDDPWQVIPTAWVQAAQARWTDTPPEGVGVTAAGNDPSRGGIDKFVVALRHGFWVAPLRKHLASEAPDGHAGAALLYKDLDGCKTVPVGIDVIGSAGASVYDQGRSLGLKAVALNGSERSEATDKSGQLRFVNKRAEWHWHLRELLDPSSGQDLALPRDPELLADLCAPRWKPTPRGVQIEEKEHVKQRIGRSPDSGEAVIYCFAEEHVDPWRDYAKQVVERAKSGTA
jgi:Terminase large subunit, T4likevirus-type, N-terminal